MSCSQRSSRVRTSDGEVDEAGDPPPVQEVTRSAAPTSNPVIRRVMPVSTSLSGWYGPVAYTTRT